jgi:hypothetical protein
VDSLERPPPLGSEAKVSFDDLRAAIEALDRIVHKYIVFFTGAYFSGGTLKPNVSGSIGGAGFALWSGDSSRLAPTATLKP